MQEAVIAADRYDAGILAERSLKDAEQQKRLQGFSGLLPVVTLNGGYSRQDQPKATYAAGVRRHNYVVTLTQPLFDLEKYATWRRADAMADEAEVKYMIAQQKLISDVSDAWFTVIYTSRLLDNADKARSAYQKQLSGAQKALDIGDQTRLEVDEAQANYDNAVADVITIESKLKDARIRFEKLTGLSGNSIPPGGMDCIAPHNLPQLLQLKERTARQNLNVRAAEFSLEQSRADTLAATGRHMPVVSLQASYGNNWSRAENGNELDKYFGTTSKTRNTNVGVNVSMPLFAGGSQVSQSIEASHRKEQSRERLIDAQRQAMQDLESAWSGLRSGEARMSAQRKAIVSAKRRMESTKYARELGLRTTIDALNAEKDYFKSLSDLAQAQYEYVVSGIKLAATSGDLDYSYLNRFNCPVRP
ncbi:TolC family outer membrane protein [Enterobacteriaceae bacterium YMB-R22]|uniref:TolC family outer membrane protein n=2 Tax=Tenebrionibacter/Tenebrionicola group TaxID=2969848 RepID=A0A8K0V1A4_9ENTR|nr:TolC family outer membrane protein [Tenebrionibacter intestinalis]MBV4414023.1 TolC family outer membrane protein [Tenebrionicola larvae]MBV5096237.1 TolC family outer membrane protein [Tenebrionicola larvae]